eukprot:g42836.t1
MPGRDGYPRRRTPRQAGTSTSGQDFHARSRPLRQARTSTPGRDFHARPGPLPQAETSTSGRDLDTRPGPLPQAETSTSGRDLHARPRPSLLYQRATLGYRSNRCQAYTAIPGHGKLPHCQAWHGRRHLLPNLIKEGTFQLNENNILDKRRIYSRRASRKVKSIRLI